MLRYLFAVTLLATCFAEELGMPARNPLCKTRNGYIPIEGNCDGYYECRGLQVNGEAIASDKGGTPTGVVEPSDTRCSGFENGLDLQMDLDYQAIEMQCQDGLHFNPQALFPDYPCGYPTEVSCEGRGTPQPARATSDCPHLYGFFPSTKASPSNCGAYRMCVEGLAIEMNCPYGLAFNPAKSSCDWPDAVTSCDADAYLGFKCPVAPLDEYGQPIAMNYKFEGNCYAFIRCEEGHARVLTCDVGFAFDSTSGRCVDADKVKC